MQQWKHGSRLTKNQMELNNESGITLVELLAALSLLSLVLLLAGGMHMFGQRNFITQTDSASQTNNLSYAMSVISTDVRKSSNTDLLKAEENLIIFKDGPVYKVEGNQLKKDDVVIAESIASMDADFEGTYGMTIVLTSTVEDSPAKTYKTTITFRGDPNAAETESD